MKQRPTLPAVLLRRVLGALPVVAGAAVFTFFLARLLPGDPVAHLASGLGATPEGLAALRHRLGLDLSLPRQFWRYLRALLQGDWGHSFMTGDAVRDDLRTRLPASLELTVCGFAVSLCAGLALGVAAALRPGRWPDHLCRMVASVGGSLPSFFIALLLIHVCYFRLGWAPEPTGRLDPLLLAPPARTGFLLIDAALAGDAVAWTDAARHLLLPAGTMALFGVAPIARIARSALLEALGGDAVRTARSLGLPAHVVLRDYALAQAAPAIVTTLGMVFSYLLGANVAVEKVFAWPGIGSYALDALAASDYAPLQGFILCVALVFVILNLLVDLLVAWLDPRARRSP
ncbi:ABC transporter permease [Robbsia sp. Bb-Pol-6]|uniref:ABC transporter permease n=1 Tax=Robbsia betulipollinis TaxID=2981849 RepID=A0ABT3ZH78_9BURK|nr:ABC transporter permease [Robbsia betulipollinis]